MYTKANTYPKANTSEMGARRSRRRVRTKSGTKSSKGKSLRRREDVVSLYPKDVIIRHLEKIGFDDDYDDECYDKPKPLSRQPSVVLIPGYTAPPHRIERLGFSRPRKAWSQGQWCRDKTFEETRDGIIDYEKKKGISDLKMEERLKSFYQNVNLSLIHI